MDTKTNATDLYGYSVSVLCDTEAARCLYTLLIQHLPDEHPLVQGLAFQILKYTDRRDKNGGRRSLENPKERRQHNRRIS